MTRRNELLEEDIKRSIQDSRFVEPKKQKQKKPIFYLTVVCLVTLAVLISLLRYL